MAQDPEIPSSGGREHKKGKRSSSKAKHQKGGARKRRDRAGERADKFRGFPRKRPFGYKGPWPPFGGPRNIRPDAD